LVAISEGEKITIQSERPFVDALVELVTESDYVTSLGTPNMSAFARSAGISYETLRKVMQGKRGLTNDLMERAALALGVRPQYFLEYRLNEAREMFDVETVGPEKAAENLMRWVAAEAERRSKRRRR